MPDRLGGGRLMLYMGRGVSRHEIKLFGVDVGRAQSTNAQAFEILMPAFA